MDNSKSKEYQEGYQHGLNDSRIENPFEKTKHVDAVKWEEWRRGNNDGYRDFREWVNKMCN